MVSYNVGQGIQGGITGTGTGFAVGGPVGAGIGGVLGLLGGLGGGQKKEKIKTFDPYTSQQRDYSNQLLQGVQGQQGNALKYLNDILSDNPEAFQAFEAPAMQNFQRRVLPGISEQFSGIAPGGSSAFNQTIGEAGKELQLGLAQQRANLKQQALQALLNMGGQGLQGQLTPYIKGGKPGLNEQLAPFAAEGFKQFGEQGGFGDILGWLKNKLSGGMQAAPATSSGVTGISNPYAATTQQNRFGLPGFLQ